MQHMLHLLELRICLKLMVFYVPSHGRQRGVHATEDWLPRVGKAVWTVSSESSLRGTLSTLRRSWEPNMIIHDPDCGE